jgi:hypothetical protein
MQKGIYHEREGKMGREDSGWMGEDFVPFVDLL